MDSRRPDTGLRRRPGARIAARPWIGLGLALLALGGAAAPAVAQCDEDKIRKAAAGANGYQQIDATLCEGIYGKDVSGATLMFIGLTGGSYLETYAPVQIGWSAPEGVVHLRAHSWAEQSFQMDARVEGSPTFEWWVSLLQNESIPLQRVGLVGWMEAEGRRLHVPLRVSQGFEPEPGAEYAFQLLPNVRLREVAVTLAPVEAAGERPTGGYLRRDDVLPTTNFPAAQAFDIWVSHSDLSSPGIYFLEIRTTQASDDATDTMALWFYHGG